MANTTNVSTRSVDILYRHPHIVLYLEDNTAQPEDTVVENDTGLYGIQVGAFEGGREGVVLRYSSTAQQIEELGEPDYEKYGQAGYNAYNALDSKSCGMYIMRVLSDDAMYANKVLMARFKIRNPKKPAEEEIDHVDTSAELVAGKNLFSDMGSSALGSFVFYGKVPTGITGDTELDGLFSHITPDWLAANPTLPKFTFALVRFTVPDSVTSVGSDIKITQISKALKNFYTDAGNFDPSIVANGNTATKTKSYAATDLLGTTTQFDLGFIVQEDDTVSISIEWNDTDNTVSDYTFNSANVEFVDPTTTAPEDADSEPVEEEKPSLEIQYYATTIAGMTNEQDLLLQFSSLVNDTVDEDGYYNMPLMLFYAMGRGLYGNNLRIRIADATDVDLAYNFHRYLITVMQLTKKTGLKNKEYIRGSINEAAWDDTGYSDGSPAYLQDLINDVEYGSQKINVQIVPKTLELMLDLYNEELADGENVPFEDLNTFDPIFGMTMASKQNEFITRTTFNGDTDKYEPINLEAVDGFALESGSDGSMTYKRRMTVAERADYDAAYEKALLRAFGDVYITNEDGSMTTLPIYDKLLKSRYSTPADFMFDANFPDTVKERMAQFSNDREYDCMCYLDSGLNTTVAECVNWLKSTKEINGYNVIKDIGCYKYRDAKFTRKIVPCTMTHFIAKALPAHLTTPGIQAAFARGFAKLKAGTDFIPGSFYPIIDPDDHETKKVIDSYAANCYEAIDRTTFQRATAITTCQNFKVDRADEFNEYILNRAVKIACDIMNDDIYAILDDERILAYSEHAKKQIEFKLAGLVRNVSITMSSDEIDRRKSILRLVMHLEFNTVCKYGAVNVILDPRGTKDKAEAEALLGGTIM